MYGLLGFKTHAKVLMVVRRERGGLNASASGDGTTPTNGAHFEDISMFTAREDIAEVPGLLHMLTGYSALPLER